MSEPYADDSSIADDDDLWRYITPEWVQWDHNRECLRVTSAAFQNQRGWEAFSVLLASSAQRSERTGLDIMRTMPGYSMVSFSVGFVRSLNQGVARDPTPDEPAHCLVLGKKTGSVRKKLVNESRWVVEPPRQIAEQKRLEADV